MSTKTLLSASIDSISAAMERNGVKAEDEQEEIKATTIPYVTNILGVDCRGIGVYPPKSSKVRAMGETYAFIIEGRGRQVHMAATILLCDEKDIETAHEYVFEIFDSMTY